MLQQTEIYGMIISQINIFFVYFRKKYVATIFFHIIRKFVIDSDKGTFLKTVS